MRCFGICILNGATILKNTTNDQVYLKDVTDNFKKFTKTKLVKNK